MMEPMDRVHETKTHLVEQISVMLGGRAAESLVFNEVTTGASDDIAKATEVAKMMVTEYGMSELGPISLESDSRMPYEQSKVSEEMSAKIDAQVKKITDEGYRNALEILKKVREKLDILANELLEKETLESEEFGKLIGPKPAVVPAKA
jgi:cell division protease FtsH